MEKNNDFNIDEALDTATNIYNNTVHSVIRLEPLKAFKLKSTKKINKIIENTIKSQININKDLIEIKKSSKALLCRNYDKKGNILLEKKELKKFMIYLLL